MTSPQPTRTRRTPYFAAAIVLALIGVGITGLVAQRLGAHQRDHGRTIYVFSPVTEPAFEFAGRLVEITGKPATDASPLGSVSVTYGDQSFELLVPFQRRVHTDSFPGLVEYEDWLRVMRFAPISGKTPEQFIAGIESGEIPDRLCIVARIPRQGVDAETWGRVWKRDWTFAIRELMPDGTINAERFAYPQGRPYDEEPPTEVAGVATLQPDTWQYDAALYVMPTGSTPKIRIIDSALRSVGWPFAVAVIAFILATACVVVAFMPTREDVNRRIAAKPSN